ncbi:MAG: acetoacetyl-CoA reductase [Alphaproteobacteria bacterium]|nr:acetoacetyl-CoA reductase [Alphaproteobacteria bacterium]
MSKKIALVTGGTRGIGKSICIALKDAGYHVVANYASRDEVAEEFTKETGITTYKWDISDFDACDAAVKKITTDLDAPIAVLVNNAGITKDGAMHKMSAENWGKVIHTNLDSCFNMARAVIESMRSEGFGRIISISSVNGQLGQFGQTNYSAAKSGIFGFTKALARETASRGITVNAIAPGYIATEMVKTIPDNIMEKIVAGIPIGRLGEPEEVARCVVFLADENASFITGETLSVNGGQYME